MLLPAPSPSAWLATRLAARYGAPTPPQDTGWWSVRDMLADDAAWLRSLHQQLSAGAGVPPRAAANYLAGWVGGTLAGAIGFALTASGAGFVLEREQVRWRQHTGGWIDAVDLGAPHVLVPPGHPWAGQPEIEVIADAAALRTRTVRALVDVLRPIVDACHGLARVGKVGLWNEVGDGLGMALAFQRTIPARAELVEMLDAAVATPGAPWKARPSLDIADSALGPVYVGQKGGCCLAFTRSEHEVVDAGAGVAGPAHLAYLARFPQVPGEPQYCSTCRFRTPDDCQARQLFWLEQQPAVNAT